MALFVVIRTTSNTAILLWMIYSRYQGSFGSPHFTINIEAEARQRILPAVDS
jgi:hypothetical protein